MAYEKLSEDQRAALQKMDADAESALLKLRADMQASPELKPGIMHVLKWVKAWYRLAGYKRLGEALANLAKELL